MVEAINAWLNDDNHGQRAQAWVGAHHGPQRAVATLMRRGCSEDRSSVSATTAVDPRASDSSSSHLPRPRAA